MSEVWRDVVGFEGLYEVSSHGRVKSLIRNIIMKPSHQKNGYLLSTLFKDKKPHYRWVHRMVCEAFHGSPPSEKHQTAHKDRNRSHNFESNLRWATHSENEADKVLHDSHQKGSRHAHTDLTEDQVEEIFTKHFYASNRRSSMVKRGTVSGLVKDFSTTLSSVENIIYMRTWGHITKPVLEKLLRNETNLFRL